MTKFSKSIGIVGGAGPMASAFLYTSILRVCQEKHGANDYADFPEIIIVSYPFTRGDNEKIREEISKCFSKLKMADASLYCIASHSFHGFLPPVPSGFISIVDESLKEASRQGIRKILVLASETTIRLRLYEGSNIQCVYPAADDQRYMNQLIREVAGGKIEKNQAINLERMISRLNTNLSFDGVLIACTELPLIHDRFPIVIDSIPVINTIRVLAVELVKRAQMGADS